jgi:hypothetical protein
MQSLVVGVKSSESDAGSDSDSELEKRILVIDAEPNSIVSTTTKVRPDEPDEPEEGEHLFHSHMWVKGTPLHLIIDSGSHKNLISAAVVKQFAMLTSPHPHPYTIRWLHQGSDLHVIQQCRLAYNIKPFKDEALCDVTPLEICDVILGQPYLWKHHVVYESSPCNFIITLDRKLHKIPEVVPSTSIFLISTKHYRKVVS